MRCCTPPLERALRKSKCNQGSRGSTRSMRAPSCELWRSPGEAWRTHNAIFMRASLTFARVPANVPPHSPEFLYRRLACVGGLQNVPNPVLPCFCWKKAGKTTKQARICYPYRTPKVPSKEGKHAQEKGNPRREKIRSSKKTRIGRTGKFLRERPRGVENSGGGGNIP